MLSSFSCAAHPSLIIAAARFISETSGQYYQLRLNNLEELRATIDLRMLLNQQIHTYC